MKKIIFFLLISTTSAVFVSAQSFHIGVKAGANLGKIDGESFKQEFNLGYQLGAYVSFDFNKNIGIQPELLFSQTNTTVDSGYKAIYNNVPGTVIGSKAHLNYLSIPILLRINADKLLTLNVGPQFSIHTNKDETLVQNGKDAIKSGDFAAVFGAQINLGSINIYGRYNVGLNNLNDIDNKDKWKSQQLQFGLGLRIL